MTTRSLHFAAILMFIMLASLKMAAQTAADTTASLIRFTSSGKSFKIPMTNYCFVKGVRLKRSWAAGWVMKWDVVKEDSSNLLFMEMNSTDVKGWMGNGQIAGSVQLVFELPAFNDSIEMKQLSYKTKGLSVINNYGGIEIKSASLDGKLKIVKRSDQPYISSAINLFTRKPDTKQQFVLTDNPVRQFTFEQFQAYMNRNDSLKKAELHEFSALVASAISSRDSIWKIEKKRFQDSLKIHPYTGSFRFWASHVDKPEFTRTTYVITADSIVIKEGPYDFIYLAKNYAEDSIYYKHALTKKEKALLTTLDQIIGSDTLKEYYSNHCIMDGLILSFSFESAQYSRDVTVSNYYQKTIASVIDFINTAVPKKYKLWYGKESLLKDQNDCETRRHN